MRHTSQARLGSWSSISLSIPWSPSVLTPLPLPQVCSGWCCQFPCVHSKSGISPVLNSANDQTRWTFTRCKTDQCLFRARACLTLSSTGRHALLPACRFPACRFPMCTWRSEGGDRSHSWAPELPAWPGPDYQCLKIP